jgi:tRNA (cmo5U34)-methyltransferase
VSQAGVVSRNDKGLPMSTQEERDQYFADQKKPFDFKFTAEVAGVFDDMVSRSVPFYHEMQRMTAELAADLIEPDTNVYDLGCSTGTTLVLLDGVAPPGVTFYGIDDAPDMLARCEGKLKQHDFAHPYRLMTTDLNAGIEMHNASLAVMGFTLQFIRPLHRDKLVADIYEGLNPNGGLILLEKVLGEDSHFNRLFIKYYYDMKRRNGYSEIEISQKREALENVLIPYKLLENREMLLRAGFRYVDVFFKWYNFCGIVALK